MQKKILIINGHPDQDSFNQALSEHYIKGVNDSGGFIESINIRDLRFNPNLKFGYKKRTELEPDLLDAIKKIQQADHLVWVFPMWWFGYPAMMKGFIDRVFLPGIMFEYRKGISLPKGLLKGKTGRIIMTADTPKWYNWLVMRRPAIHQFKKGTLEFCGVKPVKVTYISTIKNSTEAFRKQQLKKVFDLGKKNG